MCATFGLHVTLFPRFTSQNFLCFYPHICHICYTQLCQKIIDCAEKCVRRCKFINQVHVQQITEQVSCLVQ